MFNKALIIITSEVSGTLEEMCLSILSQIEEKNIIKISFFSKPKDNNEYLENISKLRNTVNNFYTTNIPLISYIAQESFSGKLIAEVMFLTGNSAEIERHRNYIVLKNKDCTELLTGCIIPDDMSLSTYKQSCNIFNGIDKLLRSNGFEPKDIYRQWNYIQEITKHNDGSQNYQEFNDARSIFYNSCNWTNGYPAATGIGADAGGVMVEINAVKSFNINKPIDNPLQIAAHNYSQKVLDGKVIADLPQKSTPKFERARLLEKTIYISGTAAIRGEESIKEKNAAEQTAETMEIMDRLVSRENIPVENNGAHYDLLRIYVKYKKDFEAVKNYMDNHYPAVAKHYLIADICRPELLVEIEGTAHI